ncbi:Por secretion system C-terminal sorting domain-containing protein [Chryseobacterium oleae]|uniref:Por secretion system C-terminal sorting domain-containing protein n=1 Tax=Chryseobacterium oleae TaxID=491207 RepID=A0A1I4VAP0_CHROL|nr:T9SS type A sorting domain-containing protein [Chryseobacterium oleae]SFM98261.1 Por secretion system C-terminal sorting domain-containing protein [Chryseobacterium oleae]
MKKNYSIALCLFSAVSFAQQQMISFENSDGFYTGDIHGQGTWISTPTGDVPPNVLNQLICTDNATDGMNSLKIVKENTYGTQSIPIIGAFDNLPILLSHDSFTVSFDINMSQLNGSIFSFQGLSSADEKYVVRVDFDHTGTVKILKMSLGIPVMESTAAVWSPNMWYRLMVVGTPGGINYFLNGILIYSGTAAEAIGINQLRFVHDNAQGTAYIDNLKVHNVAVLSIANVTTNKNRVSVYPNPATDFIKINSSGKIKSIELYDSAGKKIQIKIENDKLDVRNLSAGLYLINIKTENGNFSEKFIKK